MSESLILEAYSERQKRELDDFMRSAPATDVTGGDKTAAPVGAQAQQQPGAQRPGVMSEITEPFQQAGKQMADAMVPPGGSQAGVPRRLWEFTKGIGNATMV